MLQFYKLKYLRNAIRGTAIGVIDSYELVAENYEAAVNHVHKLWNKPGAMARRLIGSLLENDRVTDDFKSLQKRLRVRQSLVERKQIDIDQLMQQIAER